MATAIVCASALAGAGWVCWEGADVPLTDQMRAEYEARFKSCTLDATRHREVEDEITLMMKNRARYVDVAEVVGVPWYVVAAIHMLECSGQFDCHLHNGDPLTARTVDVPAGRPTDGKPPFMWEASAIDALQFEGFDVWRDWSIAGTLFKLEVYNGMGSRFHGIATPYLWGGSNLYRRGKYVSDHHWDPSAVSKEIGAAVLLRRMVDQALIEFPMPAPPAKEAPCAGVI